MDAKPEYLSLRQAAKELGVERRWLKGHLAALNIPLMPLGPSLAIKRDVVDRIKSTLPQNVGV